MPVAHSPPHYLRILHLLESRPAAVFQLWGWPGCGKRSLLSSLAREGGKRVQVLERAQAPVPRAGVQWWIWLGRPDLAAMPWPGAMDPRLVFADWERVVESSGELQSLRPEELLLTESEVSELVEHHATGPVSPELVRRLAVASDGWLKPLVLALAAGALGRRPEPTAEALVGVPAISSFLRHEVLDLLPAAVQDLLLELAVGDTLDPVLWREVWDEPEPRLATLSALIDRWGLALPRLAGGYRLPRLLTAFLRTERERRWSAAETFARCERLALAALSLGKAPQALTALLEVGDAQRVATLIELIWLDLLAEAPVETVRAALRLIKRPAGYGGELLALVSDALSGERRRASAGLADLAGRPQAPAAVAVTARLILAALRGPRAAPEVAAEARRAWSALRPIAPALERLAELVEERESPAPDLSPGVDPPLADQLVLVALRSAVASRPALVRLPVPEMRTAAPAKPALEVALLGLPRVAVQTPTGRKELAWPLRRAFTGFAFLASAPGQQATREELIDAMFPGELESVIERNFHPTLSHLRRAFRQAWAEQTEPIQLRQGAYRLNPAIDWRIDTVDFESLIRRGSQRAEAAEMAAAIELWQAAWRLYGGAFLEGDDSPWAVARRESFEHLYVGLLRRLGDALYATADFARAMDAYRSLLLVDPLEERVHLAVMRILARQGRRDLVRRQYDRLCTLLRDELGVEPLQETSAEYHRLMG